MGLTDPARPATTDCFGNLRLPFLTEGLLHQLADLREHGCTLALRSGALGGVGRDDNGRLAGWPDDGDAVARVLAICACLVGYAPARGQFGPEALTAGEARLHPKPPFVARRL